MPHLQPVPPSGLGSRADDHVDAPEEPSFLPPMVPQRRLSARARAAAESASAWAALTDDSPVPVAALRARRRALRPAKATTPTRPAAVPPPWPSPSAPVRPARAETAAPAPMPVPDVPAPMPASGVPAPMPAPGVPAPPPAVRAAASAAGWTGSFQPPPAALPSAGPAFALPPQRRPPPGRWLRSSFPWLAPRSLGLLTGVALLAGLAGQAPTLYRMLVPAPAPVAPVPQNQLRQLIGQMEECRGIESLLVMLPAGPERHATLARLQAQQQRIDSWLRDNSAWVAASHGAQAAAELRAASAAWRVQQQRVAQVEVVQVRNGLARESRQLLTGPSANAYRTMVLLVERLAQRQP